MRAFRLRRGGTLSARFAAVQTVMAMLAVGGVGESGCLLGQHQVPDDAALTPLTPPVILEDPNSPPMPGSMIVVDVNSTVNFNLRVLSSSPTGIQAKMFINRDRPCRPDDPLRGNTCGAPINPAPTGGDGGIYQINRGITFRGDGCYYRVDLYVSSEFVNPRDATEETTPVREGDLAHARWFVVTRTNSMPSQIPPLQNTNGDGCDPTHNDGQGPLAL